VWGAAVIDERPQGLSGPEELETLTAAFDACLLELRAAGVDMSTEQKLALVKKRLA
jgi:hypothetical protein